MIPAADWKWLGQAGHYVKVYVQKNPPAIRCTLDDPAELPAEYQRVRVEPDNAAALAEFQATGRAPVGFAVTVGEHVRIR